MDTWNQRQKNLMQSGGNTKLKALLEDYGIAGLPVRAKYTTKAAQYYRESLQAQVDNLPAVTAPSKEEGRQAVTKATSVNSMSGSQDDVRSTLPRQQPPPDGFAPRESQSGSGLFGLPFGGSGDGASASLSSWGSAAFSAFGTLASKAQETAATTYQNMPKEGVLGTLGSTVAASATWLGEKGRTVVNTVQDESFWNTATQTVTGAAGQAGETLTSVVGKAADFLQQQVESASGAMVPTSGGQVQPTPSEEKKVEAQI